MVYIYITKTQSMIIGSHNLQSLCYIRNNIYLNPIVILVSRHNALNCFLRKLAYTKECQQERTITSLQR